MSLVEILNDTISVLQNLQHKRSQERIDLLKRAVIVSMQAYLTEAGAVSQMSVVASIKRITTFRIPPQYGTLRGNLCLQEGKIISSTTIPEVIRNYIEREHPGGEYKLLIVDGNGKSYSSGILFYLKEQKLDDYIKSNLKRLGQVRKWAFSYHTEVS
jgi:hypothetical protein